MKTYAAIAVFLFQFLIAAASESIVSASLESVTKRSNDSNEVELKTWRQYRKCVNVPVCTKKGGKKKCYKRKHCFISGGRLRPSRPRLGRPRRRCQKSCSNLCTKSIPPKCQCKITCTTVSYRWETRRTKPKHFSEKVGKPFKYCKKTKAKPKNGETNCYSCTRFRRCWRYSRGRKSCYRRLWNKCSVIKAEKEMPKKEDKKEVPKKEDKKDVPKKEDKKDEPKKEDKKDVPKKEDKTETPKKEEKEETPKKEKSFEEGFDEQTMDLNSAIKMIDTIPDKDINKQVHDEIKKGDVKAAEKLVHDFFETFVSKMDGDEKAEMMANKSKIIAALDVAVEHYNDDK